jgi:copper homeostasis protein
LIKEACIQSYSEALIAQRSGAHRIELCSNINLDGLTPKKELIKKIISSIKIPIRVMIRPRQGNFNYSENELKLMESDIAYCKKLGVEGVVFGILNFDFTINIPSTKRLVKASSPLKVTFHKAIDISNNSLTAVKILCQIPGITSILSSGRKKTAREGAKLIKQMNCIAKDRLSIIPAGKITFNNINHIHRLINVEEYHGRNIVNEFN